MTREGRGASRKVQVIENPAWNVAECRDRRRGYGWGIFAGGIFVPEERSCQEPRALARGMDTDEGCPGGIHCDIDKTQCVPSGTHITLSPIPGLKPRVSDNHTPPGRDRTTLLPLPSYRHPTGRPGGDVEHYRWMMPVFAGMIWLAPSLAKRRWGNMK